MSMTFGTAASLVELHITAEARLMPCKILQPLLWAAL